MAIIVLTFRDPFLLPMDSDEPGNPSPRVLRGFRKRWTSEDASAVDGSDVLSVHELGNGASLQDDLFGHTTDNLDGFSNDGSWNKIPEDEMQFYEPESPVDWAAESSGRPKVFDPRRVEPAWINCAVETTAKRQKMQRPKLPWEVGPFGQVFRTSDMWEGTVLSNHADVFVSTAIGCADVLNSELVAEPHAGAVIQQFEPPVRPLNIRRIRHELPDEDIRRVAICKLRDLLLQDPMATQLEVSVDSQLRFGDFSSTAEQSIRDCFRMKASSTLQKRAGSLWHLAKILKSAGHLNPLRLKEEQLYEALCKMREEGAGPTSAQHMIEALFFLDATAKLLLVDLRSVVSGRCRGVAKDMYLTKNPLEQKHPLLLVHVQHLETLFHSLPDTMKCVLGQLLFCVHACCRWKDAQRLKDLSVETGHGETLIHAEALRSKTATSAEARTRFLPYVAMGTGVTGVDWGSGWIAARQAQGLDFGEFVLPSFSERSSCWTTNPMSASEATFWLREFLDGAVKPGAELNYGSHSCKTTVLTWAGRCLRVPFTPTDRRLLGHHLEASMKSILTYSRESYVTLYSKVLQMFRLIREQSFDPDLPAIDRVVQLSEGPLEEGHSEVAEQSNEHEIVSDSESSVASECGTAGVQMFCDERGGAELTSLFPDFAGVPESSLMVHRVSGLIHVINEDGYLLCGRQPSLNFKEYGQMLGDRSLCEGCSQCKKAFLAHGS